jgi:hypothetical protein
MRNMTPMTARRRSGFLLLDPEGGSVEHYLLSEEKEVAFNTGSSSRFFR